MILINEDEIHEIQRIWRMERGDWKNSAFEIYERVCGEKLEMLEDLGGFGKVEQEILTNVCQENKVSQVLVSKLLHAEFSSQGMGKHSKVFNSLNKILSEEWRDDLNEIVDGMKKERDEKKQYR
jgi:DNA sulfur modification protein DndC